MDQNIISVILPVFNGGQYLHDAIESVLNQTFSDFEFIIVNDGSTDHTKDIILSYGDPRIRFVDNAENKGLIYSLNKGLELANGKYIARMDADDISFPDRFKQQVAFMETHPEIGICGTAVKASINGKERVLYYPNDDKNIRVQMLDRPPFSHPSIMMRKSILDEFNITYSQEFEHNEDYRLYIDLLKVTQAGNLKKPLIYYNTLNPNRISAGYQAEMTELRTKNRKLFVQYYFRLSIEEADSFYGSPGIKRIKSYLKIKERISAKEKKILSQIWYTDTLYLINAHFFYSIKYLYILLFDLSVINLKRWFYLFSHYFKNEHR